MKSIKNVMPRLAVLLAVLFVGVFQAHAVNTPFVFSTAVVHPNGVAATSNLVLASSQDDGIIRSLSATGAASTFTTIPIPFHPIEIYFGVAPGVGGNWTRNDIFATDGSKVYKIANAGVAIGSPAVFATPCPADNIHSGINFDNVGTFGFAMIVTCGEAGTVVKVACSAPGCVSGAVTSLRQLTATITEGPDVTTAAFTGGSNGFTAGSQLLVTQEDNGSGTIFGLNAAGTTVSTSTAIIDPESNHVIPGATCNFGTNGPGGVGGAFFVTDEANNRIMAYPASQFAGLTGQILVPAEYPGLSHPVGSGSPVAGNIKLIALNGTISDFDASTSFGGLTYVHEGSDFIQCQTAITTTLVSPAPPATTLNSGATAQDSATVTAPTGSSGATITGTVTYSFFTNGTCTGTASTTQTVTMSGGTVPNSAVTAALSAGSYSFWASYSGDANYNPAGPSACEPFSVVQTGIDFCSPGLWKTHPGTYSEVTNLTPNTLLSTLGINFDGRVVANPDPLAGTLIKNLTIAQALALKGGGFNALTRDVINAYIGSKVFGTNALFSTAQVITLANAAYISGVDPFSSSTENCPISAS